MAIEWWVGTLAFRNPGSTTPIDVPYPSVPGGILAGDLLLIVGGINIASTTLFTPPSGWSSVVGPLRTVTVSPTSHLIRKDALAAGGESGTVTVASATTSQAMLYMVVVRGQHATTPIPVTSTFAIATAATAYDIPTMTVPDTDSLILVWGASSVLTGTWSPPTVPATFTEEADSGSAIPGSSLHSLLWTGSGATGTINLVRSTSVRGNAIAIAIAPAAAAALPIIVQPPRRP